MTILDKIIAYKKTEVSERKKLFPASVLERREMFGKKTFSLKKELLREDKVGIISEFKRKSPSKSGINPGAEIGTVVKGYEKAGVSGISVLTDLNFFGGRTEDLVAARQLVNLPVLRKDFMVDEYQLVEAKAMGADVILLIAAALNPSLVKRLASLAKSLNLEVLLEIHNKEELEGSLNENIDMVGVNNRNLKTFEVSIENSVKLASFIPGDFLKISESGLGNPGDIVQLKTSGYRGFLIGETFMKEKDPGKACEDFISAVAGYRTHSELTFRKAAFPDLPAIEHLAHKIWKEVYPGIISNEQVDFMLEKMYSQESLKEQIIGQKHEYTLVFNNEKLIGYLDVSTENGCDYFLHKLYVDTSFHGKEVGKKLYDSFFGEKKMLKSIRLQVNRKNKRAINFYHKLGFHQEYEKDFDIGNGFYMCDYVMLKKF